MAGLPEASGYLGGFSETAPQVYSVSIAQFRDSTNFILKAVVVIQTILL